ncbi:hypothetical protein Nepgr_018714 [Nepenthes gracilis]|uniref:Uncharacterized protein n=1 Tax=Nepenthes gracilis TaxID=150966 RepID=A0AAD3XTN9_NEPGR|nr:hypothetical protein Nepgr_018714 [Nepenthes gracilis]
METSTQEVGGRDSPKIFCEEVGEEPQRASDTADGEPNPDTTGATGGNEGGDASLEGSKHCERSKRAETGPEDEGETQRHRGGKDGGRLSFANESEDFKVGRRVGEPPEAERRAAAQRLS